MSQKRAHFIGIAGMGMSATAILLKEQNWAVSGSDADVYPPASTQLERHHIPYKTSYSPSNVPKDMDLIVIGKNARLARENNAEVRAAYESGIRIASFPEVLREILEDREPIVVAGSYGKSTITALIAWCLSRSGVDAGWFFGASSEEMEPAHLGTHSVFVIEGDEYPTSHDDPQPKFAHYRAHDALITAASHDHVNVYKTHGEFLEPFRQLAATLPQEGILALCQDEPFALALKNVTPARVVTYGLAEQSDWRAAHVARADMTAFDLIHSGKNIIRLSTTLIGEHNLQNIVGASVMLLEKRLLAPDQLAAALKDFKSLVRRLDKKTTGSSVLAYEGFGSSREKLRAAIKTLKERYPDKRLVVVFEPHTFSWRNKRMLHWFDDAFEGTNLVLLYKPTEQGADTHDQSSQEEMAGRLSQAKVSVKLTANQDDVMKALAAEIHKGDIVLLSSSGPMDGLIERIPAWLDEKFGA